MAKRLFNDIEADPSAYSAVQFDRDEIVAILGELRLLDDIVSVRQGIDNLKRKIASLDFPLNGNAVSLRRDVQISELDQIREARTIERARYYVNRLERG